MDSSCINKIFFPLIIIFLLTGIYPFPAFCDASAAYPGDITEKYMTDHEEEIKKAAGLINRGMYSEAENILLELDYPDEWQDRIFFLLGRLYKESGSLDIAGNYLSRVAASYPPLKDYALKLLSDINLSKGDYKKVLELAGMIKNSHLLQGAKKHEISALLYMENYEEAIKSLFQYTGNYTEDWDYRMMLARLLKESGDIQRAARIYRDLYITASPLSDDAMKELQELASVEFTKKELVKRGDSLYRNGDFQEAEKVYKEIFESFYEPLKSRIAFSIGMCQFMQKKYNESAKSFGILTSPEAMYWRARSYYRIDDRRGFEAVKKNLEAAYPTDRNIALLMLMEADEFRRQGRYDEAERVYSKVAASFPSSAEDAMWGIGWMNYSAGRYSNAREWFSKLASYTDSREHYKYIYWKAKSSQKIFQECVKVNGYEASGNLCGNNGIDILTGLPFKQNYYGYLIRFFSQTVGEPAKIEFSRPEKPKGEIYDRIELLALLGLIDEAVAEVTHAIRNTSEKKELMYLGYIAMDLGRYTEVIYFAEPKKEEDYLPYSYPLGYWEILKPAAQSRNLDEFLVAALIREESRYDPKVVSWAGAVGLMQLMPATAKRISKGLTVIEDSSDLHDIRTNIVIGTHYLSELLRRFKLIPFAIASYNAGEKNLERWLDKYSTEDIAEFIENIPFNETRNYVKKVLKSYWQYRTINGLPVSENVFFPEGFMMSSNQ